MTTESPIEEKRIASCLVTAIVTTFNRPRLVRRAIRSVLEQTYMPIQIIVIEDGSDVGIKTWLENKSLDQVLYKQHTINKGLAAARNTGLALAEGEYVAYLDDDDEWRPTRIQEQVDRLMCLPEQYRKSVGVAYCGIEVFYPERSESTITNPINNGNLRESIMNYGAQTLSSTFLFSKTALQHIGGFDETLKSSIDHDIWMSLAVSGYEVVAVNRPLVVKYQSNHQKMTTDTARRIIGVSSYVEKWRPSYREWFGEQAGDKYADRYFIHVIGTLAAGKLVDRSFRQGFVAVSAIWSFKGNRLFACNDVIVQMLGVIANRILPQKCVKILRKIKRVF